LLNFFVNRGPEFSNSLSTHPEGTNAPSHAVAVAGERSRRRSSSLSRRVGSLDSMIAPAIGPFRAGCRGYFVHEIALALAAMAATGASQLQDRGAHPIRWADPPEPSPAATVVGQGGRRFSTPCDRSRPGVEPGAGRPVLRHATGTPRRRSIRCSGGRRSPTRPRTMTGIVPLDG
jgi:hypothetical protein